MPEIPNVVLDEVIESEWGNDLRDRSVQRYADATARTAQHASPANGDLSFLSSTGKVYVYYSGSWRTMYDDLAGSVAGYVKMSGSGEGGFVAATGAFQNAESVTFTKPAAWAGYELMAWGSVLFRISVTATIPFDPQPQARIVIGGDAGTAIDATLDASLQQDSQVTIPATHRRTGLTATAAVTIQYALVANHSNITAQKQGSTIHYMAVRTS